MKITKKYTLDTWYDWNDHLDASIEQFINDTGLIPEVFVSNEHTQSQIDYVVFISDKKEKMSGSTEGLDFSDFFITSFASDRAILQFAVTEELKDKEYQIVYVDDFCWAGDIEEPVLAEPKCTEKEVGLA